MIPPFHASILVGLGISLSPVLAEPGPALTPFMMSDVPPRSFVHVPDGLVVVEGLEHPRIKVRPRDHVVQFYRRDEELLARIGAYLAEALQGGGAVVVLASASRRAGLETTLAAQGVDLPAGREAGLLCIADADETLARFLVEGRPDPRLFLDVVGHFINQAGLGGRPVYVYGEMVAVLWEAGHVNTAIAVEALWNELRQELPFSLFCAYPAEAVTGGDRAALAQVCGMHSGVIGAPPPPSAPAHHTADLTRVFPGAADTPRAARHFVIDTLQAWGVESRLVDNAALVVTELTTNAMMHAGSGSKVRISARRDAICIAVEDAAAALPIQRSPAALVSSGRGLAMVAALSQQWGADLLDDGKVVWAELPL
jgi:anti-sigma regulatory factor (Ser/Thr protein kinase)